MTSDIRIDTLPLQARKGPLYPKKTPATKLPDLYVHHVDTVALNHGFYCSQPVRAVDGRPKPLVLSRISDFTAP